jgi:hypothetical protein
MPVDLGSPQWFILVADADTPSAMVQYNGRIVGVPQGTELPTSIDSVTIAGITVWGYARTDSSGNIQWVMRAPVNPDQVYIDGLPGAGGWLDTDAREVFYEAAVGLLKLGVSSPDMRTWVGKLFAAAIAEHNAHLAGS